MAPGHHESTTLPHLSREACRLNPQHTEIQMTVPLYSYEHEFQGYIAERYALRLEAQGVAQVIRQKGGAEKGKIRRVVLHRRPGDPKLSVLRDYQGQSYSYRQELDDGHQPWALRPLGHRIRRDQSCEYSLAPAAARPIFLRVVLDCLVSAA